MVTGSGKEHRIGGAGNVALNVVAIGSSVTIISVTGNADEGNRLLSLLNDNKINTDYLCKTDERITTNKIRIISSNQHMMRLDAEMISPLSEKEEHKLIESFTSFAEKEKPQLVNMEDYNKGLLTENVI